MNFGGFETGPGLGAVNYSCSGVPRRWRAVVEKGEP